MPTWLKRVLMNRYAKAFTKDRHPENVGILVIDMMQYVKSMPKHVRTLGQYIDYLVTKVRKELVQNNGHHTVIVCLDRDPPPIKVAIAHKERYGNRNVLDETKAPYLPVNQNMPLPDWDAFSSNRKLLQRELYPRLFNALLQVDPGLGQTLILHGFPGRTKKFIARECIWDEDAKKRGAWASKRLVPAVVPWEDATELPITPAMEAADPDLYNRVFLIQGVFPSPEFPQGVIRIEEVPQFRNSIKEADLALVFYDHFFPESDFLFDINDGDIIPIEILYAAERLKVNEPGYRNRHFIRLPEKYSEKQKQEAKSRGERLPKDTYIDVNLLFSEIRADKEFGTAGVQNHEVMLVFMIILAGTDFLKGHFKGIGKDTVVWPLLLQKLSSFSHMVMLSKNLLPDSRATRRPVIDEDQFGIFADYCYIQAFGEAAEKKNKNETLVRATLKRHLSMTAKGEMKKDTERYLPSRNKKRSWARIILWNINYWVNGMKGGEYEPDAFEEFEGLPYYGFELGKDGKPEKSKGVSAYQKPVDDFYRPHLLRGKRAAPLPLTLSPEKRQKIVDALQEKE